MDEFHYYGRRPGTRSGLAGPAVDAAPGALPIDVRDPGRHDVFEEETHELNGRPSITISSKNRPVPLEYAYSELPLATTLESLVAESKAPAYVVHFTQLEAAQSAQDFMSINVCTREEKAALGNALEGFKFTSRMVLKSNAG